MPKDHPLADHDPLDDLLDQPIVEKPVKAKPKTLVEAPTREEFLALQDEFLELQGDDSDAAVSRRLSIRAKIRLLGPHAGCGDEPMVEIEVPASVTGETFKINQKVYHGKCFVPACEARQLAWMVDKNRQVDRDRFRGQQKTVPGFEIKSSG